ncbi:ATP-grasp domain-containing protein [Sporosarcina sp. ACRSM]|uniref:ATP-grasp domain-containing protein n=1 Tax=Sporosarcina sp. ACRSM TaxID=2918216 RepID=UPI001EF741B0|nr:ATP-grasp domain-containing protein [Sporosarcina sp. ACRSM]MCG7336995.1 ATP-grasp domain-containing protein [Sporosarcina sp. ACRSM]
MKGYVYYAKEELVRNRGFIDDLMVESEKIGIDLHLLVEDELPDADADFILFRDRNPEKAVSFEQNGFHLVNRAQVNDIANDKLKTFELAILLGVPAVPTKKVRSENDINTFPCVLKTIDGHGGTEVMLCNNEADAGTFFTQFRGRSIIVQPYIESNATDVRVFMLGQEVLGAVKRSGNDSFKSNYTLGGSIDKYTLSNWQEKEVTTIARALKSEYIGIDFLLLPDGSWLLNEIEDPVGARSLYKTHDFSVAERLIEHVKRKLTKPKSGQLLQIH